MLISIQYEEFHPFDLLYPGMAKLRLDNIKEVDASITKNDIVLLWGGEDISPAFYKQTPLNGGCGPRLPSRRDMLEWAALQRAQEVGALVIGVCRGMQMMTAFTGGYLIQDTIGHAIGDHGHEVSTSDGHLFHVNSYHHQLCVPNPICAVLATAADHPQHRQFVFPDDVPLENKLPWVEAIDFRPAGLQGFGVQWHPEWMESYSTATEWIFKQLKEF